MKKIFVFLFILFLSACSAPEPEPVLTVAPTSTVAVAPIPTQEPTASEETAPEPIPMPPEMQEYLGTVDMILVDIAEAGDELDELFFLAADNPGFLDNENWLKLANDTLDRMSKGADAIDAITPVPAQAEKAHEYFKLAAEELRMAVKYQHEIIQGDFDSAYTVTEHMQAHLSYAEQAFDEIEKLRP